MNLPRVYLCAGDGAGWAVDEDLRLTREALRDVAKFVDSPAQAQVIHAVWWEPLMRHSHAELAGKHVICHMAGDPLRCWGEPRFLRATRRTTLWIAQSRDALAKLKTIGASAEYVPYAVDTGCYERARADVGDAARTGERLRSVAPGAYVIANFHRDTEGAGLAAGALSPKLVKGPDVYVEILAELRARGRNVAALLAGPRRHWVRAQLSERGVPYVFAGVESAGDDYPRAIMPREELAALYKLCDLCLITSRSEGGPRAVLEAAAASRAVLSSRVGHAPDVLPRECLYDDVIEAVERIERDIDTRTLQRTVPIAAASVRILHSTEAVARRWREVYGALAAPAIVTESPTVVSVPKAPRVLSLWNKFTPPPWGGGNQFMLALQAEAERLGVQCVQNEGGARITSHIVNSVQFDREKFESLVPPGSARVIHRIDGPISSIRGTPESIDDDRRCFEFNRRYATATVIQSWHTRRALRELGLEPVRPVLILNSCDPAIFHRPERTRAVGERTRLVATSWSPNPGKGAAVYQWLDEHLDHSRVEFTFVGNIKAKFVNAGAREPMTSEQLAEFLRTQDLYITASRNDPCSNALIEALACGLPAIYLRSGGHPELAGFGGLAFERPDEVPGLIDRAMKHRAIYSALARPESMRDVCKRYITLAFEQEPFDP